MLVRFESPPAAGPFILLREVPGSRVYFGAVCDAEARIQEWVEIWVQTVEMKEMAFAGYQEQLSNHVFDKYWQADCAVSKDTIPDKVIATSMEHENPSPILVRQAEMRFSRRRSHPVGNSANMI